MANVRATKHRAICRRIERRHRVRNAAPIKAVRNAFRTVVFTGKNIIIIIIIVVMKLISFDIKVVISALCRLSNARRFFSSTLRVATLSARKPVAKNVSVQNLVVSCATTNALQIRRFV